MTTVTATPRTINRGANPYAPIIKQANQSLTPQSHQTVYRSITQRASPGHNTASIQSSLKKLAARLGKLKYTQEHFGKIELVPMRLLDINIDIQRDVELEHQAAIIERFDPRVTMVVMATRLSNGRFSAWEGQQTTCILYHLLQAGLLDEDVLVQVKVIDEDLEVPGSDLKGEAVANYGFRQINGFRKPIDAYHMHRSRVNGVRLYDSNLVEDKQSEELQQVMERNNMFPAKSSAAKANRATPGMITYIHGINLIGGHGLDKVGFNRAKQDLDWALAWHNRYFYNEKGVDGGFILAFGRLAHTARLSKPKIVLDRAIEDDLSALFKSKYGSPKAFHADSKQRLKSFQRTNNLKSSWSDACLLPTLISDYVNWGGKCALPQVSDMVTYAGI